MELQGSRVKKRKLKMWVKVTVLLGFLVIGAFQLGGMMIEAFLGGVVASDEGESLDRVKELREQGKEAYLNWNEEDVLATMHKMSHQKVKASEKWGAVEITPDRVEELYTIVEGSDFDNRDVLLGILENWREGYFGSAVSDHNTIWEIQGGTVGKATGLLNPAEEKEFIENTFGEDN